MTSIFPIKNLDYIKREYENLNNIEKFLEETEIIFDIYPVDMFMTLDVYKSNSDTLWVEIKNAYWYIYQWRRNRIFYSI